MINENGVEVIPTHITNNASTCIDTSSNIDGG